VEPHRAMLAGGFAPAPDRLVAGALYCCECNLCTLFSCPEDLDPKNVCVAAKPVAREKGLFFAGRPDSVKPHPLADQRRIPTRRLMAKLGIAGFRNVGPLEDRLPAPSRVALPLKQHAGEPARPVVRPGEKVREGDVVAAPAEGALGARIHASIAGTVRSIDGSVVIEA
jgi:Na+-translocating ferredoxin:NAD+ oxidoreductase RnfC subunit